MTTPADAQPARASDDAPPRTPGQERLAAAAGAFLDALIGDCDRSDAPARAGDAVASFAAALRRINRAGAVRGPRPRLEHAAMTALDRARAAAPQDTTLPAAGAEAAVHLDWLQVFEGGGVDPALADGMLAAQIAGSYGCFPSEEAACGLFLLAPGVVYPPHTHAAAELYVCLSGVIRIRHGVEEGGAGAPIDLTPGARSVTPPHRLHALEVGPDPVLLAYVWTGALLDPIWWWEEDGVGGWRRTRWRRPPGRAWRADRVEPVTAAVMAQAHA